MGVRIRAPMWEWPVVPLAQSADRGRPGPRHCAPDPPYCEYGNDATGSGPGRKRGAPLPAPHYSSSATASDGE